MAKLATMVRNQYGEKMIKISFPYEMAIIFKVRNLIGVKYLPERRVWIAPLFVETLNKLKKYGFVLDKRLTKFMSETHDKTKSFVNKKIAGLKGKPFDYQYIGIDFIERNNGRCLLADEMGLGKTMQALGWCQLHRDKKPVLIVTPASLKLNWEQELKMWMPNPDYEILSGKKPWQPTADYLIINYDILPSWVDTIKDLNVQVMITDECFPAGTKVLTPSGSKNIETINKGDVVLNAFGEGVVEKINKRKTNNLIRLHLNNDTFIDVTPNHLFFSTEGWIQASDSLGKILFDYSDIFYTFVYYINTKRYETNEKEMRMVQKNIPINFFKKKVLWDILFSEMEKYPAPSKKSIVFRNKKQKANQFFNSCSQEQSKLGKGSIRANEKEQPIFQSNSKGKNKTKLEKIWASFKKTTSQRWKWENITQSTKNFMDCFRGWLENRISNMYKTIYKFRLSNLLQSRHSTPQEKDLDRSGWMVSSIERCKENRQEKGTIIENIRVERIEILESRCREQPFESVVYNLQVSNHPSYYANGLLVHNCHYYKNNSSKRTKAIKRISKNIPHVIALSGTPIVNKPIEAYNAINIINPNLFPSFLNYTRRYCNAKYNGYGWDFNGASNTQELHETLVNTIMIRRLKKDVLKDLPEKLYSFVPLEFDAEGKNEYQKAESSFIDYVRENYGFDRALKAINAEVLVQYGELKKLAVKGALNQSIEWIRNFLEIDGKLVVFAIHRFVIDEIVKNFEGKVVKIDGSVALAERQKVIERFQNDNSCRLFVGNIRAAGVGITLTAASNVAFLELPWTPGELRQAIDRVHRIGQKNCVNIHYLFAINTIMDKVARLIDQKQRIIDSVLDGKNPEEQDSIMLYDILKSYEISR